MKNTKHERELETLLARHRRITPTAARMASVSVKLRARAMDVAEKLYKGDQERLSGVAQRLAENAPESGDGFLTRLQADWRGKTFDEVKAAASLLDEKRRVMIFDQESDFAWANYTTRAPKHLVVHVTVGGEERRVQHIHFHKADHQALLIEHPTKGVIEVDENLVPLMKALWREGIETTYSCQGGVCPVGCPHPARIGFSGQHFLQFRAAVSDELRARWQYDYAWTGEPSNDDHVEGYGITLPIEDLAVGVEFPADDIEAITRSIS